ncbi:MmyB family transcriptional regulator [Streptomyces chattanoogensis]|uniref:MmyB family transcriptional regulator n=1 Tax=Streptomyces chattanoogensis TaxID=66876 RepID=UPI0036BFFA2F
MDQLLSREPETRRSPGTYGRLERGSLDKPAPEYLRGVARILQLSPEEWSSLVSYARGELPSIPLFAEPQIVFSAPWSQPAADVEPLVHISDFAGNILGYNGAFACMFPGCRVPVNMLHYILFEPFARRELFPDWHTTWGPQTVAALRAALAQNRHNHLLRRLAARCQEEPHTRSLMANAPAGICRPHGNTRALVHRELGPGWVHMGIPLSTPGARITQHLWQYSADNGPHPTPTLVKPGELDVGGFFPAPAEASSLTPWANKALCGPDYPTASGL